VHLIDQKPKLHKLSNVVSCGDLIGGKLLNPKIMMQTLLRRDKDG
jgi:hypothetical protein